jgi:photosystem II stability/assembly factor-like uncharacterized protein
VKNVLVNLAIPMLIYLHVAAIPSICPAFPSPEQSLELDTFANSVNSQEVSDLFFLDSTHGWMAITDHNLGVGYVLRTANGGNSWQKFSCPFSVRKLFFINPKRGWAMRLVGDPTLHQTSIHLLDTVDGGQHWNEVGQKPIVESIEQSHTYLAAMAFMDELNGWIVGAEPNQNGLILQTHDGGRTFERVTRVGVILRGVAAGPKDVVFVFGDGCALRSVDKGKHWEPAVNLAQIGVHPGTWFSIEAAKFIRDGHGWLAANAPGGMILATDDFGQSWQVQSKENDVMLFYDLAVVDPKRLCALGGTTVLFCSADGGSTWSSTDVLSKAAAGQSIVFEKIVLLPSGRGWVVRNGGYLYRTIDGGRAWKEVNPTNPSGTT